MNKILLLLSCIICISCAKKSNCTIDEELLKYNDSLISIFKSDAAFPEFLAKIEETELHTTIDTNDEAYRFIIIGPWGNSDVYNVKNTKETITISKRRHWTWNKTSEDIDSLGEKYTKQIKYNDWQEIKAALDTLNFWRLPVLPKKPRLLLDARTYMIEGYNVKANECTSRNYHVVSRISPRDSLYVAAFVKVFSFFKD